METCLIQNLHRREKVRKRADIHVNLLTLSRLHFAVFEEGKSAWAAFRVSSSADANGFSL